MKYDTLHYLCIGGPQGPRSTCKYKGDLRSPEYFYEKGDLRGPGDCICIDVGDVSCKGFMEC